MNYILQGVLNFPNGTAYGNGLANYQAAGKTGTSNVASGNGTPFAAFAGYTTALAGYVSVFNPVSPTEHTMTGDERLLPAGVRGRRTALARCSARTHPLSVWHMTFDHANLTGSQDFQPVPSGSSLWSTGDGQSVKQPARSRGKGGKAAATANGNGGGTATAAATADGGGGGNGGGGGGNGGGTARHRLRRAPATATP